MKKGRAALSRRPFFWELWYNFQGTFKAVHVKSNEQLLHVSAYVNLNDQVHQLGNLVSKSSWNEYSSKSTSMFCDKSIILEQFNSQEEYVSFAKSSLESILKNREEEDKESIYFET